MADEVSPTHLREGVEFSVKLRGYDPEQVDDFLDRVADGVEQLQQQLRAATERAVRAEGSAAEHAETEVALRRTLVLAQRTADEVVKEAEERAGAIVGDAERRAADIVAAAEREAARTAKKAQKTLRDDIDRLEVARTALEADVESLRSFLADERDRLHRLAEEQLQARQAPDVAEVELPAEPLVADVAPEPEPELEPDTEPEPEPVVAGAPEVEAVVDLDAPSYDHDPFLHELRKASGDDAPLGPRDDEVFAGFDSLDGEHDLGLDRTRWGRRRRR